MNGNYLQIAIIARSQLDYPDGIGIKHSLFCMDWLGIDKPLADCTRQELTKLIKRSREEYNIMKYKHGGSNGKDNKG